jgi:2-polyprenyl-6-methoxyphenol hydroxylase-like FAD-dependent oxidoreductase
MPRMDSFDVCVRGAGAVGMATALALSRQGLGVAITGLARKPAPSGPDVRAYALNAGSRDLLALLKVWDALPRDAVTPVHDMRVKGDAPEAGIDFSAWSQGVDALAWIVDAAELESAMRAALRFAPHVQAVDDAVPATLTVLAEGKDCAERARLGVQFERHAYDHTAVAARLRSDRPHDGVARQWFGAPEVLALLPFDRPEPGSGYALVWSVPAARAAELLALPGAEFERALAEATGGAAGTLRVQGPRAGWPLALGRADRVHGPGWVLAGDAAHLVHPLAGQGLNLGLADVATLARVIAGREPWRGVADERVLARYARERDWPVRTMAWLTDGLWHLFAQDNGMARELRNRGMTLLNHMGAVKRLLTARALDA